METRDEEFMLEALREAKKAQEKGEIPVGAVIVYDGEIIARGHNLRINESDATAHAEVVAIKNAGKVLNRWNLTDCDIYVTLEPCAMCAGAIVNARIKNVIFGAYDLRFGCCGSVLNIASNENLNHRAEVKGGILFKECSALLSNHFKRLREEKN